MPKIGKRFYHARVLDPADRTPQLYQVTRVAGGRVYYRAIYEAGTAGEHLGTCECCPLESFPSVQKTDGQC